MAQLIVRNVDEKVVRALKLRAAQKGHSAEAEHRALLEQALLGEAPGDFKALLLAMPGGLTRSDLKRSLGPARKVEL